MVLRVGTVRRLLQGSLTNVLDRTFAAAGLLTHLPEGNPCVGFFSSLAGNPLTPATWVRC